MGLWKYPQIALLILAAVYGVQQIRDYWDRPATIHAGAQKLGACQVTLRHSALEPDMPLSVRLSFAEADCWQSVRKAAVALDTPENGAQAAWVPLSGNRQYFTATLPIPEATKKGAVLKLRAVRWDGTTVHDSWALGQNPGGAGYTGPGSRVDPGSPAR